jgi:hypothetical protein
MPDCEQLEWCWRERAELYQSIRELNSQYVRYLLFSVVGTAAIASLVAKLIADGTADFDHPAAIAAALIAPLLTVSWAAGSVSLGVDLWIHRSHLAHLDCLLAEEHSDTVPCRGYFERRARYNSSVQRGLLPEAFHTSMLNIMMGIFPAAVGVVALGFAVALVVGDGDPLRIAAAIAYCIAVVFFYCYVFVVKRAVCERVDAAFRGTARRSSPERLRA